jgi:hypothetical protein
MMMTFSEFARTALTRQSTGPAQKAAQAGYLYVRTIKMKKAQAQSRWEDGVVGEGTEHIELRHGDAAATPYEDWRPIARIGKPRHHRFPVQWLLKGDTVEDQAVIADARRELDFYLVEKKEPDPWAYARYHCNTGANMYSRVHWSYFPSGREGERVSSMVIQLSAEEVAELFEKPEAKDKSKENEAVN